MLRSSDVGMWTEPDRVADVAHEYNSSGMKTLRPSDLYFRFAHCGDLLNGGEENNFCLARDENKEDRLIGPWNETTLSLESVSRNEEEFA